MELSLEPDTDISFLGRVPARLRCRCRSWRGLQADKDRGDRGLGNIVENYVLEQFYGHKCVNYRALKKRAKPTSPNADHVM